ncbi:MAG: TetR/AcrR family transcriptional regulator [Lachnospiraceae bacterium]|nr:TetR/AcrR family transcriptional regulator [Lachnospiraceae bacterium]
MGRKAKITKEMVLEAAFSLLDEGGIGAVGIKSIAAKLGCSTQPVSWLFGSMTELKKELYFYAGHRLYDSMENAMRGKDAFEAFYATGVQYLTIACDHPNVFRFTNVDDPMETIGESIHGDNSIFSAQFDEGAARLLARQFQVPADKVGEAVRDTVIYTHGLALMMMFDSYKLPKEQAFKMMFQMGEKMLREIGIDTSAYKAQGSE